MVYNSAMPKRSRRPNDPNELAAAIVAEATEGPEPAKNPHAVALGRLGGKKGGPARAKKLSAKKRREIAKKAAEARWKRP
jgi:hypothetical protein